MIFESLTHLFILNSALQILFKYPQIGILLHANLEALKNKILSHISDIYL